MKKTLLLTTVLTGSFALSAAAAVLTVDADKTIKVSASYDYFNVDSGAYLLVSGNGTALTMTDKTQNSTVNAGAYLILQDKSTLTLAAGQSLIVDGALTAGGSPHLYGTVSAYNSDKYFFSKTKYDSAALPSASTITGNVTFNNAGNASNTQKNILIGSVLSVKTSNNEIVNKYDYTPAEYEKLVDAGTIKEYDIPALLTVTGDLTLQKSAVEFKDKSYLEVSGAAKVTDASSLSGVVNMKAASFDVKSGGALSLDAATAVLDGKVNVESGGTLEMRSLTSPYKSTVSFTYGVLNEGTFTVGDSAGQSGVTLTLGDGYVFTNAGKLTVGKNSVLNGQVKYSDGTTVGTIAGEGTISNLIVNKNVAATAIFTESTRPGVTNLHLNENAQMSGDSIFFRYLQGNGTFSLQAANTAMTDTALGLNGTTLDLNGYEIKNPSATLTVSMSGGTVKNGKMTADVNLQGGSNKLEDVTVTGSVTNGAESSVTVSNLEILNGKLTNAGVLNVTGDLNGEVVYGGGKLTGSGTVEKLTVGANVSAFSDVVTNALNITELDLAADYTAVYDAKASARIKKLAGGGTLSVQTNADLGSLTVSSSGLNIGAQNVTGANMAFEGTAKLYVTVKGADAFGTLTAADLTVADGAELIFSVESNSWEKGETKELAIINAGSFTDNFTVSDSVRYKIEKTSTAGTYAVTYYYSAADIAERGGANESMQNAALAWDNVPFTSASTVQGRVSSVLNTLSNTAGKEKEYVDALTALAPQSTPVALMQSADASLTAMNTVSQRIDSRMNIGNAIQTAKRNEYNRRYGYRGRSGGNPLLTQGVWAQGMVNKSKYDVTDGYESTMTGIAGGYDKRTQNGLAGFALAGAKVKTDETAGRETDASLYSGIVYGAYRPNNFFIDGMLTGTYGAYTETKNVAGVSVDADYKVYAAGGRATVGYDYRGFAPLANLRYFYAWQEDYTDAAGQEISSDKAQTATISGGFKYAPVLKTQNDVFVIPQVQILASYDFISPDKNKSVVNIGGSTYTVLETGDGLSRTGVETSAGLTVDFGSLEASLRYDGRFKKDYTSHTGLLEIRYNFVF